MPPSQVHAPAPRLEPLPEAASLWTFDRDVLHCNHGSFGATPLPVRRAQAGLRTRMDRDRDAFFREELPELLDEARESAAAFCGAPAGSFALTFNASAGTTAVLRSFPLEPGDAVLITDHVYAAVERAVSAVAAHTGATVQVAAVPLGSDEDRIIEAVVGPVTTRTRLAVVDAITSPTAMRMPLRRIVTALHDRGVAVHVDGAHAPGQMPVDLVELDADFWTGNFHKWAFSGLTAAGLYAAPRWHERLREPIISHDHDAGFPRSFVMQGTLDYTALLSIPDGIRVYEELGGDALRARNHSLAALAQAVVAEALGTAPVAARFESMALVPLPPDLVTSTEAASALTTRLYREARAWAPAVFWNGRGWLRISAQAYNGIDDYVELARRLAATLL